MNTKILSKLSSLHKIKHYFLKEARFYHSRDYVFLTSVNGTSLLQNFVHWIEEIKHTPKKKIFFKIVL